MEFPKGIQQIIQEYCYYPPKYIEELRNSVYPIKTYIDNYIPDYCRTLLVIAKYKGSLDLRDVYFSDKRGILNELMYRRNLLYTKLGIKTYEDLQPVFGNSCYINY